MPLTFGPSQVKISSHTSEMPFLHTAMEQHIVLVAADANRARCARQLSEHNNGADVADLPA